MRTPPVVNSERVREEKGCDVVILLEKEVGNDRLDHGVRALGSAHGFAVHMPSWV